MRFLCSLLLFAASISPAFGYQQMVSKNYGVPISQPTNSITMYVNMGCPSEDRCWDKIARSAIAEWNAVNAPFYIRAVVGAANIPTACANVDGRNTLQWSATKCQGEAWGDAAGYAWSYISRRGDILESDVRLRRTPPPGQTWTAAWFRHVVLHELGHVLGLGHPDEHGQEVNSVMNHSGEWTPYLQLDDRNGIRGIYGAQLWGRHSLSDRTPGGVAAQAPREREYRAVDGFTFQVGRGNPLDVFCREQCLRMGGAGRGSRVGLGSTRNAYPHVQQSRLDGMHQPHRFIRRGESVHRAFACRDPQGR